MMYSNMEGRGKPRLYMYRYNKYPAKVFGDGYIGPDYGWFWYPLQDRLVYEGKGTPVNIMPGRDVNFVVYYPDTKQFLKQVCMLVIEVTERPVLDYTNVEVLLYDAYNYK